MDVFLEAERLAGFRGRAAGTDAERRAAEHLAARLRRLGRDAAVEPIRARPAVVLPHLVHALLGIVGSVLSVHVPIAGAALVLLAALSAFGELSSSFFLARLLTGTRASQNIVSLEDGGKPGRLILVAHYDAARGGGLFEGRFARWPAVSFWSLLVIVACTIPRLFGVDASWLTAIQFVPTVVLIATVPLLVDAGLANVGEGDNRNASGVATVLRLAERYGNSLEHFDLDVVLTGSGTPQPFGMRRWLRRHRYDLDPQATAVVCVDTVGAGTAHYATTEGLLFPPRYHPSLVSLAEDTETATPYKSRELSDAYAARSAGLPAIRVSARPDRGDPPEASNTDALARSYDFLCEMIERIDAEIGPRLTRA